MRVMIVFSVYRAGGRRASARPKTVAAATPACYNKSMKREGQGQTMNREEKKAWALAYLAMLS